MRRRDSACAQRAETSLTPLHCSIVLARNGAQSAQKRARGADLRDLSSLDEVRDAVAAERRSCAPGEWVLGFGLEYDVFRESGIRGELFEGWARRFFSQQIMIDEDFGGIRQLVEGHFGALCDVEKRMLTIREIEQPKQCFLEPVAAGSTH